jgi:hypothetical protein
MWAAYIKFMWGAHIRFKCGASLGPLLFLIRVGRGFDAVEISLNLIQAEKLCRTKLLNRSLCLKLAELASQWSPLKSLR